MFEFFKSLQRKSIICKWIEFIETIVCKNLIKKNVQCSSRNCEKTIEKNSNAIQIIFVNELNSRFKKKKEIEKKISSNENSNAWTTKIENSSYEKVFKNWI